jgi:carbonic anhydrase
MGTRFGRLPAAALSFSLLVASSGHAQAVENLGPHPSEQATGQPITADAALQMLKEGNERFVSGKSKHPHEGKDWRKHLIAGQKPFATILGCSDSRVIPELIFDEGFGGLFVIRVAGNIVDDDVKGSIEYAVEHLDSHLVVVLGHENCGAVTAALAKLDENEPRELSSLVHHLHDTICEHHEGEPDVDEKSSIATAVRKNVLSAVRQLNECPDLNRCMKKHKVKVVGAIYDLDTSRVDWLN